jgi:AcrR family transcriptional regulator
MRKRAEQVGGTRRRIIEATVHLHSTVGPAASTISAIAEQAGVTRLTIYRHFPDEESLFAACSAHWLSQQRPPDPEAWAQIAEPEHRVPAGLVDLYRFYRSGAATLTHIYGEIATLPEQHRHDLQQRDRHFRDVLLQAFPATQRRRKRLRAVVGHAVSFSTWRSLCLDHGLPDRDAAQAMTTLILTTATG